MKDELRELAERWSNRDYDETDHLQGYAEGIRQASNELLAILDAEGDGGAVDSIRALLIEALTGYRCNRTVDEDGEPLPLVDVLSPGEGGTIQSGTDEIEYLAEYLADELPPSHTHRARSGVVRDEDVIHAWGVFCHSKEIADATTGDKNTLAHMRAALESFARRTP